MQFLTQQTFNISTSQSRLAGQITRVDQYLEEISIGIDLSKVQRIEKSLSNKYMSVLVIKIVDPQIQKVYGDKNTLIRCYHNRKKFFEMALDETPKFLDIFHSVIAYILPDKENEKNNTFTIIDVGRVENPDREIEQRDGLEETREIEHGFEGQIEGFKLGYYINPESGYLKAVMWGGNKIHIKGFNPDISKENDSEMEDYLTPWTVKEIIDDKDQDITNDIKKIYDFGTTQVISNEYEEPEYILAVDNDDNICLLRGQTWGKEFKLTHRHSKKEQKVDEPVVDNQNDVNEILTLKLIQTYKIVGLMKMGNCPDQPVFQVLTFDTTLKEDEENKINFIKKYPIKQVIGGVTKYFSDLICEDAFNNVFYFPSLEKEKGCIRQFQINNDLDKVDDINITLQIAMNIIGNNVYLNEKTKGLLIQDFCATDNLLIAIHGKVVTCFDIMNKRRRHSNAILNVQSTSFYDFDHEPVAVWMNDKKSNDTAQRWKLIVAFRNGEIKEVKYSVVGERESQLKLADYVLENKKPVRLQGKIVRIMRSRNSIQQPVYFVIEKEKKRILATIEFKSQTYREYNIPGTDNDTTYIILDNDLANSKQEIICIQTKEDIDRKITEQNLIHAEIRIGQYKLNDSKKEINILNKEDLQSDMINVKKADDLFVCGQYIYFFSKKNIDRYNIKDNSVKKTSFNEFIKKMLVFDNQFFYWRTIVEGSSEFKYQSNIYFDGLNDISMIRSQCGNKDVQIHQGMYPHLNKLQYDSMSESIAGFVDFNNIKVIPLLHSPRIKVKIAGNRSNDPHILATKFFEINNEQKILITLDTNNQLRGWNMQTGKFLLQEREVNIIDEGDFSAFKFHQRIDDNLTLLKSYQPLWDDYTTAKEYFGTVIDPDLFWYDSQSDLIKMYKYLVVSIDPLPDEATGGKSSNITSHYKISIMNKFIGPHYQKTNFGLFAGNQQDVFIFYYKDGEKTKLTYAQLSEKTFEKDPTFSYLKKDFEQMDTKLQRISIHSPDFKNIIIETGIRQYSVIDYRHEIRTELPANLCQLTVEPPNFISNDNISFITEDKIMKSYRYSRRNTQLENEHLNDEFLVTHCNFPGSTDRIDLATLLKVGKHYIGENCLTYERYEDDKGKIKELIAPNNFNYLFQEACQEHYADDEDFKELKIIQAHYKSKVELSHKSYFGYFFTQKESDEEVSNQLYVISTFTYYHWRMLQLLNQKKINYRQLSRDVLQNLSYVQLPDGSTLLHKLSKNKDVLDYVYQQVQDPDDDDNIFYIPLFKDSRGMTALDITLTKQNNDNSTKPTNQTLQTQLSLQNKNNNDQGLQQSNSMLKQLNIKNKVDSKIDNKLLHITDAEDDKASEDVSVITRKTAGLLLKNIGLYPFNLFKVKIKRKFIATMIEEDLVEFADFIENSAKTPSFLYVFDRAKVEIDETCGSYVFETNDVWANDQKTLKEKFDIEGKDEKVVSLKILDLAKIHHYTNNNDNIIYKQLSKSNNPRIFEKKVIRAMIEQKWDLTRSHIIYFLLIPYLAFITLFSIFVMNDYTIKKNEEEYTSYILVLKILIFVFVGYFGIIEVIQCVKEGFWDHVSDPWNYLDIIPPIFILSAELVNMFKDNPDEEIRNLYSITALAMWLRFLYFFRVFKSTGYYIRMVVEVIKDMGQFFFIFGITVFAFAQSNFIVFQNGIKKENSNPIEMDDVPSFWITFLDTYRNSIGDIQDGNISNSVSSPLAWSLLIVCTLFVVIVLFNLLIAIVGETFGKVQENKANTMYEDLVELIVENQFLITEKQQSTKNQGRYLVIVLPDDEEDQSQEIIQNNFKELKGQIKNLNNLFIQSKNDSDYNNERILRTLKKVQEKVFERNNA